jgi:hypothetical protein
MYQTPIPEFMLPLPRQVRHASEGRELVINRPQLVHSVPCAEVPNPPCCNVAGALCDKCQRQARRNLRNRQGSGMVVNDLADNDVLPLPSLSDLLNANKKAEGSNADIHDDPNEGPYNWTKLYGEPPPVQYHADDNSDNLRKLGLIEPLDDSDTLPSAEETARTFAAEETELAGPRSRMKKKATATDLTGTGKAVGSPRTAAADISDSRGLTTMSLAQMQSDIVGNASDDGLDALPLPGDCMANWSSSQR